MNICLLGLSGSGKTCYLYTATHVLTRGVNVNGHIISAISTDHSQTIYLNKGIEQMANGKWPDGSAETKSYPFNLKIDGKTITSFTICDYRGGALDGLSDKDRNSFKDILKIFEESGCIIVLVDGATIMNAMDPEIVAPEHRNMDFSVQLKAKNELNYIESLVEECNKKNRDIPILLVITKSDMFYPEELIAGKKILRELLPSFFAFQNDMIVGITAIAIGENLENNNGELEGTLCLNAKGNLHLPILFALFQEMDNIGNSLDINLKQMVQQLFSSDKINFYRGGKPVVLI